MIQLKHLISEDLHRWVKEKWTDQHGRPCGSAETKGVKKCRPSRKVSKDTPKTWSSFDKKEKEALVRQKRRVGMGDRTPKAEAVIDEKKKAKRDACYHKVKARYDVWPSAYGSLALSKCRNVGAANWGNKTKNEEIEENFEDGKNPGRKGLSKRFGVSQKMSIAQLEKIANNSTGERRKMAQWNLNMKRGRMKKESMEEMTICNECAVAMLEDIKAGKFSELNEAEYQGRKVPLGKPMRGDVKKFKVYVRNAEGNVVKVNFGHGGTSAKRAGQKTMRIRKSDPARRRSFRARHNCDNPGPRTKARYWSCRKW